MPAALPSQLLDDEGVVVELVRLVRGEHLHLFAAQDDGASLRQG